MGCIAPRSKRKWQVWDTLEAAGQLPDGESI